MKHANRRRGLAGFVALGLFLLVGGVALGGYPWAKKPGPIAGRWSVTCKASGDMVIEFTVNGMAASGKVAKLGAAGKYGYTAGEEIFKLKGTDLGKWVGELKYRSVSGQNRWDHVEFIATADTLNATQTTDDCYRNMARAR